MLGFFMKYAVSRHRYKAGYANNQKEERYVVQC
jgi:hypothetical protein